MNDKIEAMADEDTEPVPYVHDYGPVRVQFRYQDIKGDRLAMVETTEADAAVMESSMAKLWPLMPKVWSVRITTLKNGTSSYRTLRRPTAVAASPRVLPRPRRAL